MVRKHLEFYLDEKKVKFFSGDELKEMYEAMRSDVMGRGFNFMEPEVNSRDWFCVKGKPCLPRKIFVGTCFDDGRVREVVQKDLHYVFLRSYEQR